MVGILNNLYRRLHPKTVLRPRRLALHPCGVRAQSLNIYHRCSRSYKVKLLFLRKLNIF